MSATDKLKIEVAKKYGGAAAAQTFNSMNAAKPSGLRRPAQSAVSTSSAASSTVARARKPFQPPARLNDPAANSTSVDSDGPIHPLVKKGLDAMNGGSGKDKDKADELPEELKSCDPKLVEMILNDLMDSSRGVDWSEIAGLEFAKKSVREIVVWPFLNPQLFTGLRAPARGILLFGPPGTGSLCISMSHFSSIMFSF